MIANISGSTSSSGVSSSSRTYKDKYPKNDRSNKLSYNDGSYLALEKNMKLRGRQNSKIKNCSCGSKTTRTNVALRLYDEFQYCSAEDSAIHHEMCFEIQPKFDSPFKSEVSISSGPKSKLMSDTALDNVF